VRVALIGAGSIADWHLAGLAAAGCPAALVASRRIARAREAAARHRIAETVQGWETLPPRADIHAAIIATPDATHAEIAAAFLEAGKPVLVQKPLAGSVEAADLLVGLARARRVPLEVAFMHRHLPEVVAAARLLREGAIGRVLSARIRNATPGPDWDHWFWQAGESGGVAGQIGIHGMDLLRHLIAPITSVAAEAAIRVPHRRLRDGTTVEVGVPDHAAAAYRLGDGSLATHEMSFCDRGGTDRFAMEIHGETASLALRGPHGPLALLRDGAWAAQPVTAEADGLRQHALFMDVARGRVPPTSSAEDALAAQHVIAAVARSAASGHRVALP